MNDNLLHVLLLSSPIAALAVWQWLRKATEMTVSVTYSAAVEGAKLLREWCSWLATLSTAAIGVASFNPSGFLASAVGKDFAVLSVLSFALSLVCTATLLLALPSLVARLQADASPENDLYEMPAFFWAKDWGRKLLRVGFLASAQYYFFVAAIAMIAWQFAHLPPK